MRRRLEALLVALVLDYLLGELPNPLHPVAMMGRWLTLGERWAPAGRIGRLIWGAGWLFGGMGLSAAAGARVPRAALAQGAAISTLLAYRALDRAVEQVQVALAQADLQEARRLTGWHLVSRPTADLDAAHVAAAAIESLGENLSDSVIAPICWYLVGGLPALTAYRFSNTADAMWGYRTERYEHLGKAAARCDDALNFVPARLTAALIALAGHITNGRGGSAWRVARRDHGRTASPNAGWPMAALAGALDTVLTKYDHYVLGDGASQPDAQLIAEARAIVRRALMCVVAGLILGAARGRPAAGRSGG